MNIIVCIKQVPDAAKVEIDPETGSLIREGVDSKINIYDLYALETAISIRERVGGSVTAISMGPPQAEIAIREALMLGADDGVLLSDRAFAGSDVLATSYTLSQAVRVALHPNTVDLIICGKQTTDGDTAQVGPAVAEYLGIPHVAWVTDILEATENCLVLLQDLTEHELKVKVSYPCLITVEKGGNTPRLPSYLRKKQFEGRRVRVLTLAELEDRDAARYGQNGSPTQVERIFPPAVIADKVMLEDEPEALADAVYAILTEHKLVEVI